MENHKAVKQQDYNGIIGGSDSFTVIGASGLGKSSAISRAVQLLTKEDVIKVDKNNLIVKMTNNGSNIYRCTVTNKLSGYTASADSDLYIINCVE